MSESDDAAMDISGESEAEVAEPAAKRVRLADDQAAQAAPKWSNPDPYTALPPPDETQRKKKDVVQMIRKARVEAESKKDNGASEGVEFISFDFSDEDNDDSKVPNEDLPKGSGVPNAPTGPRASLATSGLSTSLPPRPPQISVLQGLPQQQGSARGTESFAPSSSQLQAPAGKHTNTKAPVDLSASTNLGSRKRTADDQIKERPHQRLLKGKKMKADASIEGGWQAIDDEEACPWVERDHSSEPNMGVRYVGFDAALLALY